MAELEFVRTYAAPPATAIDEWTTTLRVHVVADFTDPVRAGAEIGWASQLDKLAELLEHR